MPMEELEAGLLEAFAVQSNARIPTGITSGVGKETTSMLRRLRRTVVNSHKVTTRRGERREPRA